MKPRIAKQCVAQCPDLPQRKQFPTISTRFVFLVTVDEHHHHRRCRHIRRHRRRHRHRHRHRHCHHPKKTIIDSDF